MESPQNDPSTREALHDVGEYYYCSRAWGPVISELWESYIA